MSAIWGCIEYDKEKSSVDTMALEFKQKCRLDKISEVFFGNAIIGSGIQFINQEDKREKMPYFLDDGNVIITADCIIDNREELLRELIEDNNSTRNDEIPSGELLCLAFKKWHYGFVKHVKGLFAIAIYNKNNKTLFLCTDRTSSRCLYYYKDSDKCIFSTLVASIRRIEPDIKRNELYLKDFALLPGLLPNISSTETPWENIYIIEAGTCVLITESSIEINRYYEPVDCCLLKDIGPLQDRFLEVYEKAVRRASRTSGEIGMALSGGFDSSSVAAIAAPFLEGQGKKLYSYTYVPYYDVSGVYDRHRITNEAGYVREIAKLYPNIDSEFFNNNGQSFWPYVDELLDVIEIPYKAFVNLPILLEIYRKAAQKGCKVFLNGQTGNATISYGNIDDTVYDLIRNGHYRTAFEYFNNFCHISNISRRKWFPREIGKLLFQKGRHHQSDDIISNYINPFVNPELLDGYSYSERNASKVMLRSNETVLYREDFKNLVYSLPALSYIGAMETKLGLYTGVVIRDPTRDSDVIDFCFSFPFDYYCYDGVPRYLIRGFMRKVLPDCVLYPVLKTGIQNADWIYRLESSRQGIHAELSVMAKTEWNSGFLDLARIKEFINELPPFVHGNEGNYINLFVAYILYRFMS